MLRARVRPAVYFASAAALLGVAAAAGVLIGSTALSWETALRVLGMHLFSLAGEGVSEADDVIVWTIRLPRVLVAALSGASLAAAGAAMQGLFRNPLAEPSVVGVSAGAGLGAVIAFVTGLVAQSALWLPLCSFVAALLTLLGVYSLATRSGRTPIAALLLAGIAVGSFLTALSSLLISMNFVDWQVAAEILYWMMGGLDSRSWVHVWIVLPFTIVGGALTIWFARDLDLMLTGEEVSASLGVDVQTLKLSVLAAAALLTAASVAVSGILAFVGLVVPHIVRLILGPSHRILLPASMLTGAVFLIGCDILARTIYAPMEIRLGVVTAAIGAPFFLWLLHARRRELGAA